MLFFRSLAALDDKFSISLTVPQGWHMPDWFCISIASTLSSFSSSLARPVTRGRRYSWWSYSSMLHCVVLFQPRICHISLTSIFPPPSLAMFFFLSLVCPHLAFFSLNAPLSSLTHGHTNSVVFCNFLGRLHHSCPSNVFISDLIPLTPHIHLSILISFISSRVSYVVFLISTPNLLQKDAGIDAASFHRILSIIPRQN